VSEDDEIFACVHGSASVSLASCAVLKKHAGWKPALPVCYN
jgi:hypothetical protein